MIPEDSKITAANDKTMRRFWNLMSGEVKNINNGRVPYFKMTDYLSFIQLFKSNRIPQANIYITPFYIDEQGYYEIYHYALSLSIKENPDLESLYKSRTNGKPIDEIEDKKFVERTKNILFQVRPGDKSYINIMENYFKYILNDKYLIQDALRTYEKPSINNLYFEVY